MNTRTTRRILPALPILVLAAFAPASLAAEDPAGAIVKVGTFDSRCVAFAYGRTKGPGSFFERIQELKREHVVAEEAGDEEKMAELQEQGESLQHQMHLKVFCGTSIDDILALIRDEIPKAAEAAGVDLVVADVLYEGPGVEVVDVSAEMAKLFTTDPEVIGALPEILATPVVDAEEFEKGREQH